MTWLVDEFGAPLFDEAGRILSDEFAGSGPGTTTASSMPVPVIQHSAADHAAALHAALPTGRVWPRHGSSTQGQVIASLAKTWARNEAKAFALLEDSPVRSNLIERLPEWEASVGLPDPCSGPDATIAQRQAHVRARLGYDGGQSIPYFIGFAAALGYTITVTEYAPARADVLHGDDLLYDGGDWAYVWQINAASVPIRYFRGDASYGDEALATWGNAVLECDLSRIKPAHTKLRFAYYSSDTTPG